MKAFPKIQGTAQPHSNRLHAHTPSSTDLTGWA